jgi:hypothetical protein
MRTLRLARIAAEAEGLRLREQARRTVVRAVLGVVALGFLAGAGVFAHIAAWCWLRLYWTESGSAVILAVADIVIAGALTVIAERFSPGRVELEALAVRRHAVESVSGSLAVSALAVQLLRLMLDLVPRRRS